MPFIENKQQAEIRRKGNVAKCLQAMAGQVSAYVRLSSPPASIPVHVRIDASSEWSKSALLCIAVETVTLPTRLRQGHGRLASLAELGSVLNTTGSRFLFDLNASLISNNASSGPHPGSKPLHDEGRGSHELGTLQTEFELDYTPRGSQTSLGRRAHLFSQAEIRRHLQVPGTQMLMPTGAGAMDDEDAIVEM
jgi:Tubulin domain